MIGINTYPKLIIVIICLSYKENTTYTDVLCRHAIDVLAMEYNKNIYSPENSDYICHSFNLVL